MKLQYQSFLLPLHTDSDELETMNRFLRSRRIAVRKELVMSHGESHWAIPVEYLDSPEKNDGEPEKSRLDYREILNTADFVLFSKLREVRKKLAEDNGLPVYAVSTNEQLADIAKLRPKSLTECTKKDRRYRSRQNGTYRPGPYNRFVIKDPKERIISASPVRDRVVQHAIMNYYAPVFERPLIFDTYACRIGKGTQKAVLRAFHFAKSSGYFLKMDVRTYCDSIDHGVLKQLLSTLIGDKAVLSLLNIIIDLFNNPVGCQTSHAKYSVFCSFSAEVVRNLKVIEQL